MDVLDRWAEMHALKIRRVERVHLRQRIWENLNELPELVDVLEATTGQRLWLEVVQAPLG
jgi:hypothetical protein